MGIVSSGLIRRRQRQHLSQGMLGEADGSEHRSLTTIRQSGVAPWGMFPAVPRVRVLSRM